MSDPNRTQDQVRAELGELARPVAENLRRGHVREHTRQLRGLALPTLAFPLAYLGLVLLVMPLGIDLRNRLRNRFVTGCPSAECGIVFAFEGSLAESSQFLLSAFAARQRGRAHDPD